MSYPRDLDEYSDDELKEELARRNAVREQGNCSYCGGKLHQSQGYQNPSPCRLHETYCGQFGREIWVERKG